MHQWATTNACIYLSTGINRGSNTALADGTYPDPNWACSPPGYNYVKPPFFNAPFTSWVIPDSPLGPSKWLAWDAYSAPPGTYVYSTTFSYPKNFDLTLDLAADNDANIFLNGKL